MREGIGGSMLLYIVVIFLIVYIIFMAVIINYGRTFRVKNNLLSYIENSEGIPDDDTKRALIARARSLGYNGDIYVCYTEGNNNTTYFSIKLEVLFQLPFQVFNQNKNGIVLPISGDTTAIKNVIGKTPDVEQCYKNGTDKWVTTIN